MNLPGHDKGKSWAVTSKTRGALAVADTVQTSEVERGVTTQNGDGRYRIDYISPLSYALCVGASYF